MSGTQLEAPPTGPAEPEPAARRRRGLSGRFPASAQRRLDASPGLRRVLSNVSWLAAERAFVLISTFGVSVAFINYLGPDRYGLYAWAAGFVALFAALGTLGLETVVVRELSRTGAATGEILGSTLALRLASGGVAALAACVGVIWTTATPEVQQLTWVLALTLPLDALLAVDLWFQSEIRSRPAVAARAAATAAALATKVIFIVTGMPLIVFAWLQVCTVALAGAALVRVFVRHRPSSAALRPSYRRSVELMTQAWPLALSGLAIGVYMRVDRVMIGELLAPREVGLYATAATLSELLYFVPVAMAASFAPIVARSRDAGDGPRYRQRMQSLYDFMALFGWLAALGVALLAPYLFALLFSPAYQDAAAVLRIHVFALPFVGLGLARSRWLVAEGHIRLSLVTTISGLLANLLLNAWWIPRYGGVGAAWATVVSFAVAGWASGFLSPTLRRAAWPMTRALMAPLRLRSVWLGLRELR